MRTFEELEALVDDIRDAPTETGVVVLIVRRPAVDEREVVDDARLDVNEGLVGDTWRARGNRHTPDGSGDPQAQLTVMNARAASAVAGDVSQWPLAGDQIYADFDISTEHLPPGAGSRSAMPRSRSRRRRTRVARNTRPGSGRMHCGS